MVVSASTASNRYGRGIRAIGGAETYKNCGQKKGQGFLAVAQCLQNAKSTNLTTQQMENRYEAAASGSGGQMTFGEGEQF